MQIALGAMYAWSVFRVPPPEGPLHVIAGVMAVSMLLPIIVRPVSDRSLQPRSWPGQASQLPRH